MFYKRHYMQMSRLRYVALRHKKDRFPPFFLFVAATINTGIRYGQDVSENGWA